MYRLLILIIIIFLNQAQAKELLPSSNIINNFNIKNQIINKLKKKKITKASKEERQSEELAKELQAILAAQLLNSIYENIKPDPLTGGGKSEQMFQSMLNDERAKYLDLGLIKSIKNQILGNKNGKATKRSKN